MDGDTLDDLVDRVCDPSRSTPGKKDWKSLGQFTRLVNAEPDGPARALRLLVEKLQSTSNSVGVLALEAIEQCVRNCGRTFHDELGKFRFLNELIKLISPKFAAQRTPEGVKSRIKSLLYDWSTGLPRQPKIKEAFQMLRRQGIILERELPKQEVVKKGSQMASFEDENRSALLARLLKSKHPEDLEAANRLIKDMVRQDEAKMTKLTNRLSDVEVWQNNIRLLSEMLAHYDPSVSNDVLMEIVRSCKEMRPKLFKLVQEMEEGDDGLGDILQVNDDLSKVLQTYEDVVLKGQYHSAPTAKVPAGAAAAATSTSGASSSDGELQDLMGGMTVDDHNSVGVGASVDEPFLLDLDPLSGGQALAGSSGDTSSAAVSTTTAGGSLIDDLASLDPLLALGGSVVQPPSTSSMTSGQPTQLGVTSSPFAAQPNQALLGGGASVRGAAPLAFSPGGTQPMPDLGQIVIPPSSIQMSSQSPLTAYEKNGLRILVYLAQNSPAAGVEVYVVSVVSTNTMPVENFVFQAAVPKTMRVKLQPASGSTLPPYNPLAAPASLSQIMVVANPTLEQVRFRFKIDFTLNGTPITDIGEVANTQSIA